MLSGPMGPGVDGSAMSAVDRGPASPMDTASVDGASTSGMDGAGAGGADWDVDAGLGYAFGAATVPMAFIAPDGRFRKVNPAYQEMTGRTEAELLELTVADVTHPADVADSLRGVAELLAGERTVLRLEKRFLRRDGNVVWAVTSVSAIRAATGAVLGVFAQVLDVTEAKARELALAESNERLRFLAEGADDFVLFRTGIQPGLHNEFVSSGVLHLLGYPAEEFYRRPGLLLEVLHPDDVPIVRADMVSVAAARRPKTLRFIRRDGTMVWTHTRTSPILGEHGEILGIEGISYDITARVHAEHALRDSERRFRSLVQHATDLVCLIGPAGTVEYISPSVEEILGQSVADVLGRPARGLGHPDDMDALAATIGRIAPGERAAVEFRTRHGDGSWRRLAGIVANRVGDPAVAAFVLNARDVTEQHRLRDELARRANFDQLTGLPNQLHFRDQLTARLAGGSGGQLVVASVDVAGLAEIAEAFGYDHADTLIRAVTRRLQTAVHPDAMLARTGNEEFAIAVPVDAGSDALRSSGSGTAGVLAASALAQAVLVAFDEAFLVGADPFLLDATIGAAVSGDHGRDAGLLLRRAELARRGARTVDRGFRLYSPDLDEHTADRLSLLGHLRDAIGSDQLCLHYQPKLHLPSGTICGVEALIRWNHPELGSVAPDRFIALAERSGLIAPLTRWVIGEAARQSSLWRATGIDLPIAVNITPRSLQDPAFPDEVVDMLLPLRLPAAALCLELTERAVTTDPDAAVRACRRLTEAGIQLSLDDFGTGQSSLRYLAALPISELKIDMSFVRPLTTSPQAEGIARMIIDLAHHLRQTATAEGVEDQPTADLLARLGCDTIQGYHLSRPLSAAELTAWIVARRPANRCVA